MIFIRRRAIFIRPYSTTALVGLTKFLVNLVDPFTSPQRERTLSGSLMGEEGEGEGLEQGNGRGDSGVDNRSVI